MGDLIQDLWKGHLLIFERTLTRTRGAGEIRRLLIAFVVAGVLLQLVSRAIYNGLRLEGLPLARVTTATLLVVVSLILFRWIVASGWASIGLRSWRHWSRRERLYAVQVIPMAVLAFGLLFRGQLVDMIRTGGLAGFLISRLLFGLLWGFYQEFAYRGLLQTATVGGLGAVPGLLLANFLFTFGPLHAPIYERARNDPSAAWLFLPIFGIGLLFGMIYHRSGNLWLPAVFHGLWPPNMA